MVSPVIKGTNNLNIRCNVINLRNGHTIKTAVLFRMDSCLCGMMIIPGFSPGRQYFEWLSPPFFACVGRIPGRSKT